MDSWSPGWSVRPPAPADRLLAFAGTSVLRNGQHWLMHWQDGAGSLASGAAPVYLGQWGGESVYVAEVEPDSLASTVEAIPLREALLATADAPVDMLGLGFQVSQWWRDHQFCGRCGQPTEIHPRERAKWCEPCGVPWYPRVAPCVIVVIRRGERMLLARSSRVKRHFYSLIAGFVEPGETLEHAVVREVREETGLDVTAVRYQGSQPWPFPHQLMVGFFADYAGGELVLQQDELADAGWFVPGNLPPVPPETTIAGRLIRAMAREIAGPSPVGSAR